MDYTVIKRLPDSEAIELAVLKNDGYCPCKIEQTEDTKCMCAEFRAQANGECSCGLYFKTDADYLLYTKEGCPRCDILKRELKRVGKTFVESLDYFEFGDDEFLLKHGLPVLVSPAGVQYDFKEAMKLFPRPRTL